MNTFDYIMLIAEVSERFMLKNEHWYIDDDYLSDSYIKNPHYNYIMQATNKAQKFFKTNPNEKTYKVGGLEFFYTGYYAKLTEEYKYLEKIMNSHVKIAEKNVYQVAEEYQEKANEFFKFIMSLTPDTLHEDSE